MAHIVHDFPITVPRRRGFEAVSTPAGLDHWWTKSSSGFATKNTEFVLGFGPSHEWRARVTECRPDEHFELVLTRADADWQGSHVAFNLMEIPGGTRLRFRHSGWPEENEHFRISSYCWAMYLRVLRRWLEFGETVPYETRLDV